MSMQNNAEKAADNQSSGAMLIIVGIVGIVLDVLYFTFNPFSVPEFNRFLSCGVMLALFILFFVMGVMSLKTYKVLIVKAEEESNLKEELGRWCDENLTKEKIAIAIYELENSKETEESQMEEETETSESEEIVVSKQVARELIKESEAEVEIKSELEDDTDAHVFEGDEAESRIDEALFFARCEAMKKLISANFINLDDDLLDSFVDDYYVKLYDNQEMKD